MTETNRSLTRRSASWGGYECLAAQVSLADRTVSARNYGGEIIRLQIGLEDAADIIADLAGALEAAASA